VFSLGGTLDDGKELIEFNLATSILIYFIHDLLNIMSVVAKTKRDQRLL
jgi:hypothetical protein